MYSFKNGSDSCFVGGGRGSVSTDEMVTLCENKNNKNSCKRIVGCSWSSRGNKCFYSH
jgi:hypothetical protein